jgi:hypothetical protein
MTNLATETAVSLDSELFRQLREIAERRNCSVDELVIESVRSRFHLHAIEERRAAVDVLARMSLPVGTWEEMETESTVGAVDP